MRISSAENGHLIAQMLGHNHDVHAIEFSPDGPHVASASSDGTVRIWDLSSSRSMLTLRGRNNDQRGFTSLGYSPDGRILAAGQSGGNILLWDANTGLELGEFEGHTSWSSKLSFSPDGRRLVSSCVDGSLRIWDVATRQQLIVFGRSQPLNPQRSAVFSRDGRQLLSLDDGSWFIRDGSPVSMETMIRHEGLGVVRFHLKRATSEGDFLGRIRKDPTVSSKVRSVAATLAEGLWKEESAGRERRVKSDLRIGSAAKVNLADARNVVRLPGLDPASYLKALQSVEEALLTHPDSTPDRVVLETQGIAQFRLGRYQEALGKLTLSMEGCNGSDGFTLAFLALTQHYLGALDVARSLLEQIQTKLKDPSALREDVLASLKEAESLILDASFPTQPFAP